MVAPTPSGENARVRFTELARTLSIRTVCHAYHPFDRSSDLLRELRIALLGACSDSSGPANGGNSNLSLAVATLSSPATGSLAGGPAPSLDRHVSGTDSAHSLVITRAAITLSRLHLATVDSAGCAADDHPEHDDDRCRELKTGPLLVELPVDNSVISVLTLQLPAGTYRALEAKIRTVQAADSGGVAFLAANPEFANASVRVEGTFDGAPFVYSGSPDASLELSFDPPITVGTSATTLTVHVSIDRWFTDRNGQSRRSRDRERGRRERESRQRQRSSLLPRFRR